MLLNLMDLVDTIFTYEDFSVSTSRWVGLLEIMECILKCMPVQLAWEHLVPVQRKIVYEPTNDNYLLSRNSTDASVNAT